MPGTAVTTRLAPPHRFENYTLTRVVDSTAGLTSIPDSSFTQVPGPAPFGPNDAFAGAGAGSTDDAISDPVQIGFDFNLDGIVYKQWVACTNGWMALVDPNSGSFNSNEVLNNNIWINEAIRPTFGSNAVLLAPWFDDLKNAVNQASQLSASPYNYGTQKINRIVSGLEPPPIFYNPTSYAISYYRDVRSEKGRRLIIRWASVSNYTTPVSVIKFEVVIYENGTIEYRYSPRTSIFVDPLGASFEGATIGIFMPNGTNRFRDFSVGLGYRDGARQEYIYGGFAFDPTYVDAARPGSEDFPLSASYTVNLLPFVNWPGLTSAGATFAFSPPKRRRKVLPRKQVQGRDSRISLPLVARTGDSRLGMTLSTFDDRRSPSYTLSGTQSIVNYPTTLTRFFGGTGIGVLERQDLFAGDFLVTSSVVKSAVEPYVNEAPVRYIEAFNETARHEQDQATLASLFFASGTSGQTVVDGFDQKLKSKTQIRFTLPVQYSTQLPASTSSIYYYNARLKTWETPVNSTYVLPAGNNVPLTSALGYVGGDWANPQVDGAASRIIEDARGFGPVGNIVSSGSHVPSGNEQTDAAIGSSYDPTALALAIGKPYPKSIRNNEEYRPSFDETFTLPINAPFLIEKAVFEVPLAAGPGWFADQTQCFAPLNGVGFDFAGPALTFALHRNVQLAENQPGPSRRDLILTGTVTHQLDNVSQLALSNFPPYDNVYQVRPVGFLAYANPPGGVVNPNLSNSFTGSVTVNAAALSAAGVYVRFNKNFADAGSGAQNATNLINFLLSTPTLVLGNNASFPAQTASVGYVSPLGRGGTGFQQAGRCVLGNEYVTLQGLVDQTGQTFSNPFSEAALTSQQSGTLQPPAGSFQARAAAVIPLVTHFPSPYLVMPGDRLVLSVSKMRPFLYASSGAPEFSGSLQHDIQLLPGNVNVTLYGSQIQAGVEFHDTLNQPLASNAVHELLGTEPVLDQFEVAYRNEYTGSFSDNVMLGTLGTQLFASQSSGVTQAYLALQTNRDRKLSKLGATRSTVSVVDPRNDTLNYNSTASGLSPKPLPKITVISSIPAPLTTNAADTAINPYKSYRLQDWVERTGDVRTSQFIDSSERFYDSMMPSIADCFTADGSGIFITPAGTFGDFRQVDVAVTGSTAGFDPNKSHNGWIMFDNQNPSVMGSLGPIINGNWNKSYPFEPRYLGVSRQLDVSKTILATYIYQPGSFPVVLPISPTPVTGFFFGTTALGTSIQNFTEFAEFLFGGVDIIYQNATQVTEWLADVNLSGKIAIPSGTQGGMIGYPSQMPSTIYATGSTNASDAARALFGFGDRNTYYSLNNSLLGTNHFPDCRDVEGPHPDSFFTYTDNNVFRYSPIIRGWKYGVYSGLPTFTKAYWRHGRYGQFRDMLEQRQFSKFYRIAGSSNSEDIQPGIEPAVVTVTFLDPASGQLTAPDNTWSSNLHFECTSSIPFFDGTPTNRPTINPTILNLHPNVVRHDARGNIHIA